jgi:hypothetical protein
VNFCIGKISKFLILLFTIATLFYGCGTKPSIVEKSDSFNGAEKIEDVKVIWANKQFKSYTVRYKYGTKLEPIKPMDKIYTHQEIVNKFSEIGNVATKKIQKHLLENNVSQGDKYILEITPRKAEINMSEKDSTVGMSGVFMLMASLKKADDMSELWFIKMDVNIFSVERDNITLDNFALNVISQMKTDGLLK